MCYTPGYYVGPKRGAYPYYYCTPTPSPTPYGTPPPSHAPPPPPPYTYKCHVHRSHGHYACTCSYGYNGHKYGKQVAIQAVLALQLLYCLVYHGSLVVWQQHEGFWQTINMHEFWQTVDMHVEPQAVSRALAVATGTMETTAQACLSKAVLAHGTPYPLVKVVSEIHVCLACAACLGLFKQACLPGDFLLTVTMFMMSYRQVLRRTSPWRIRTWRYAVLL